LATILSTFLSILKAPPPILPFSINQGEKKKKISDAF
jgi:hypothetical protein